MTYDGGERRQRRWNNAKKGMKFETETLRIIQLSVKYV